jgi:DNA-directed RNA polymerase specialized sigma24 family protein
MQPLEFVLVAQADANQSDAYEQRATLQTVMATMRRLRSADREVLLLRAAGELSLNEIAVVTRSSVAAVKMRLYRARSRLTQLLKESPDVR